MITCTLLTPAQFEQSEKDRRGAMEGWRVRHGDEWTPERRAENMKYRPPGTMWFCPWYHDPAHEGAAERRAKELARPEEWWNPGNHSRFLSLHYWRDWADKRPPICVVGPNGDEWIPDQVSNNGTGWTVTGDAPLLTVTPSIWLSQGKENAYHGYLGSQGAPPGVFSPHQ